MSDTPLADVPVESDVPATDEVMEQVETSETENEDAADTTETDTEAQAEADQDGEKEQAKEPTEVERVKSAMQKRIDKLTYRSSNAERQLQEALQELEKFKQPAKADTGPVEADFDTIEDFLIAKGKWEAKQEFTAAQRKQAEEAAQKAYAEKIATQSKIIAEKETEFRKEVPDYDDVTAVVNDYVAEADKNSDGFKVFRDVMMSSEVLPQLTYELGKNPDLIEKMLKMEPLDIARTLFYKEYELKNAPKKTVNVKPTATPPSPVRGVSSGNKALHEMSYAELKKAMKL